MSSSPETCLGRYDSRISTCAARRSVRSWLFPALMEPSSVSFVCLITRLSMASTSASVISRRSFTSMFFTSPCTWRRMDTRGLSCAFSAAFTSSCSSWYFMIPSFLLRNRFSFSIVHNLAGPCGLLQKGDKCHRCREQVRWRHHHLAAQAFPFALRKVCRHLLSWGKRSHRGRARERLSS